MELVEAMAQGDPLDQERLRGFESVWEFTFDGRHVAIAVIVVAVVVYLLVRML